MGVFSCLCAFARHASLCNKVIGYSIQQTVSVITARSISPHTENKQIIQPTSQPTKQQQKHNFKGIDIVRTLCESLKSPTMFDGVEYVDNVNLVSLFLLWKFRILYIHLVAIINVNWSGFCWKCFKWPRFYGFRQWILILNEKQKTHKQTNEQLFTDRQTKKKRWFNVNAWLSCFNRCLFRPFWLA